MDSDSIAALKARRKMYKSTNAVYRTLQKHLDTMPLGFPATTSGVEIRLLQEIFTAEEAKIALCLDYRFATVTTIMGRSNSIGYTEPQLSAMLDSMVCKGSILLRDTEKEPRYALFPFLVGMYEMQLGHFTPSFYIDTQKYIDEKFAVEYLTTKEKQFRVVPIEKSITPKQNIASYDEVREIIDRSNGKIALRKCVCKHGNDLIDNPCKITDRRDICMEFRDYYNVTIRANMGVQISKKEAQEITDQNEKDGLIILTSTMRDPQFLCGCCRCCCGALGMIRPLPRPVDFIRSNFFTAVKMDSCTGCQTCVSRCHMNALISDPETGKTIAVNEKRCIGCGLCVATCKSGALKLQKKEDQFLPPKNFDELFELIMKHKKSDLQKRKMMLNATMEGKALI